MISILSTSTLSGKVINALFGLACWLKRKNPDVSEFICWLSSFEIIVSTFVWS
ncbi:hypothetical protein NBX26_02550 [Mesomycoplasma hyopneumoniae]|uniref:hypothetical protein n=1 Tax=Mesomycoplasma hyopneumoniae TaxID=2099 RepID=UPI0038574B9D